MGRFKLRRVERVVSKGHVAKERHPYRKLAWKCAGRISLGRPKRAWGRSSESGLTETVL
jgi:hypothetical protein